MAKEKVKAANLTKNDATTKTQNISANATQANSTQFSAVNSTVAISIAANTSQNSSANSSSEELREDFVLKIMEDFQFKVMSSPNDRFKKVMLKFRDYFNYAQEAWFNPEQQEWDMDECSEKCGLQSDSKDICCAQIVIKNKKDKVEFVSHECMDKNIVDMSAGVWIDNNFFEYKCTGEESEGFNSAAVGLKAAGVALGLVVSSLL